MKRTLILLFLSCLMGTTFVGYDKVEPETEGTSYTISGHIQEEDACVGQYVQLIVYRGDGSETKDSALIDENGHFFFSGSVKDICATVIFIPGNSLGHLFFLENSDIRIEVVPAIYNGIPYLDIMVEGSQADAQFRKETEGCFLQHSVFTIFPEKVRECVAQHPDAFYSPCLYHSFLAYRDDFNDFVKQLRTFSGKAKETHDYQQMLAIEARKNNVAIGKTIPDFTLPDTADNTINLHQFLDGKRYVLVYFWASWSIEYRWDTKQLIPLYEQYHADGFDIISVSIDSNKDSWVEAIVRDSISWPQVCELAPFMDESVAGLRYDINRVPSNFLVDSSGTILAKNLRGEELSDKLKELMQ